jgi:gliding motility-associated-like protein
MFFGKIKFKVFIALIIIFLIDNNLKASHGMALITPAFTVGAACVTYTASSNAATCGGGPYWLQVEVRCTSNQLTGTPPATMQTNLLNWAGPGVTYNNFPWYNSLLNVPNYTQANSWPDNCVTEPYHPVVICYNNFCPGQVYWFAAREWVSGTNSVGPWTAAASFTVPGIFVPLNTNVSANPAVYCSPGNSTLTATNITGGCGASSVQWLPGNLTGTSVVVSPAATTVYTAVVSTPCNTITKTTTVTVVPVVSAAFTPLNSSACANTPVIFNHTGTAGVSHTWDVSPALGVTLSSPTATNPTVTFANPGNYTISHTVAIGSCSNVVTTNITINGLTPAFTIPSPTQCITGNSFSFNAANINGTHTYTFNPSIGAPAAGNTPNYTGSFTSAGTYTVTHTVNHNGCITSTTGVVAVNPTPSAILTVTNAVCSQNTGIIVINNTSGPGQTVTGMTLNVNPIASQTITGLAPGNYTLVQTNNFGCNMTTTISIGNTAGITALAHTFTNATCGNNNGVIMAGAVTGGSPTYSFNINNGPFSTNPTFSNLASGTYTIGVIDLNNCTFTKTVTILNTIPPSAILFSTTPTACNANNGIIGITGVTGGVAPFTFSLNGVGTGSIITGLSPGPKTITVMDAAGCTYSTLININLVVGPTAANVAVNAAACGNPNGSATVIAVTGGLAPYQYSFNGSPLSTNSVLINQAAGPKYVVIQDANGCTFTVNFNIGSTIGPSTSVSAASNVSCFGGSNGSFTLNTTGGVPNYNYTLTPGNTTSGSGIFTNLTAQNYTVNMQDAVGCVTTLTLAINQPNVLTMIVSQPDTICFGQFTQIYAAGSGGTLPYTYTWNSPGGVITSTTGGPHPVSPIVPSVYTVALTDANGCFVSPMLINVDLHPRLIATGFSLTRCDDALATLYPNITSPGNGGPYTFNWSNGATTQSISVPAKFMPVNPNIYTVAISDGCNMPGGEASFTINVNPKPQGTFTSNIVKGCSPLFVSFNAVSDGSNNVYQWNFGEAGEPFGNNASQIITYAVPGIYAVGLIITNQFGCKKEILVPDYINAYPLPIADFDAVPSSVDLMEPVINFTNYSTGATSFFWDFGDYSAEDNTSGLINPHHTYSYIGTYDVNLVAINGYGCKDSIRKQIAVKPDMAVFIPNVFTPDGNNVNEEFKPKGYGIKDEPYKLEIFDRWGEHIFTSENFNKGWNGIVKGNNAVAQEGVYVYKIELVDFAGKKKYYFGHVTLLKQ